MRTPALASFVVAIVLVCSPLFAADALPVHADNPTARTEHQAMLDLVRHADITHSSAQSGPWSAAATWKNGAVPPAGTTVLIARDHTVTIDRVIEASFRGIRVEGTLSWEPNRDSALTVDTLLVVPGGKLVMGDSDHPISPTATARLIFSGTAPIDPARDPYFMGRGLMSHGIVRICGAETTGFARLAHPAKQGDRTIVLTQPPINWKTGDRLILPSVIYTQPDEELTILGIHGAEITVSPLADDHLPAADDVPTYVANVTRNVVIESQNPKDIASRGHVMFMHNGDVDVRYAGFMGLGRTDKSKPIDDPRLDAAGHLVPGTGGNPRGRYAVHFHRTGTAASKPTAIVKGCAVVDSPGWGFVNHSSHVDFDGNVAFNVFGSAFVTEAGDEIGTFRNNFAIRSRGAQLYDEDSRKKLQDFGHEGDGFWFQGAGVTVEDNIAAGQRSSGFIFFTAGLVEDGLGIARFSAGNLWNAQIASTIRHLDPKDPDKINDPATVPVIAVPVKSFKRNTAFACGTGFTSRFVQPHPNRSAYEDGLVWNCDYGVRVRYTSHLDLRNLRLIANPRGKSGAPAIAGTLEGEQDIRYENLRVEGWSVGIEVPEVGHHVIAGGHYRNASSIMIPSPMACGRHIEITGDIHFDAMDPKRLAGRPQYDINLQARFAPMLDGAGGYRDPNVLFAADTIRIESGPYAGKQLYFFEQERNYVPFPRDPSLRNFKQMGRTVGSVPEELIDKTNAQMSEQYGLAIGGAIVPQTAATDPRIHALIAETTQPAEDYRLSAIRTPQLAGAHLVCYSLGNKNSIAVPPLDLHAGWNLITQTIANHKRSFLVFGGDTGGGDRTYKEKKGKG